MKTQKQPSEPKVKVGKTAPCLLAVLMKAQRQGLIRHVNGNTHDNRVVNLQRVTPLEAFRNKDWTVDAVCVLNDAEFIVWAEARATWSGDLTLFHKLIMA